MRKHKDAATEWFCPKCDNQYTSPIPVVGVMCICTKRSAGRQNWMKPKEEQ